MIPIIKKNNNLLFEVSDDFCFNDSKEVKYKDDKLICSKNIIPIISSFNQNKIISFNTWKEIFEDEIKDIINEYIEFITEISLSNDYNVVININDFTTTLEKIIYNCSMNRYKYYQSFI